MTQNIYDDPAFFAGYSALPRSVKGLDGAPEWPSLRAMLPPVRGSRVLDLGCGFGWFCRWARDQGAAHVRGVDVSANMLARARAETPGQGILYVQADLESLDLAGERFDLIHSALALHYIADLDRLLATARAAIVTGGHLVFSVEHPIYTAPTRPGWMRDAAGRTVWPIDSYAIEGPRETAWLAPGVIKRHRTIGTWLTALIRHGFTLTQIEEWCPTGAQIAASPAWSDERHRPMFLLIAARARS